MEWKKLEELLSRSVATSVERGLSPSNGRYVNGPHDREVRRLGIGDRRMAKNPRDSRRENKFITGHYILIDIYKGEYEMRGKVNGKPLKEG